MSNLKTVPLSEVRANPAALRGVNKETEKYKNLRDSIGRNGVLQTIGVREATDPVDQTPYYEVIDGLQRFSCAQDVGLPDIGVNILTANDLEVMEMQVIGNLLRIDTPAAAYTQQLIRMMQHNPLLTETEVAERLSVSTAWVKQRLSLGKLTDGIQELVDDGSIKLQNAYALAKLPKEEQENFLDGALTQQPGEFVGAINTRVKELQKATREGRKAEGPKFEPVARVRSKTELDAELASAKVGPAICAAAGLTTATGGFSAGVEWALSLDKASVDAAREKFEARLAKQAADKAAREAERAAKKQAEADAKVATATA